MRIFNFIFCLKYPQDYLHFQAEAEQSRAIWFVCLSAAEIWLRPRQKWFSKLNSPLPSSLAVASCCRQTTDSRDNRGLHVFRIDIGPTSDWWQTLSAAAECGGVNFLDQEWGVGRGRCADNGLECMAVARYLLTSSSCVLYLTCSISVN